jgi:hypothetical protein
MTDPHGPPAPFIKPEVAPLFDWRVSMLNPTSVLSQHSPPLKVNPPHANLAAHLVQHSPALAAGAWDRSFLRMFTSLKMVKSLQVSAVEALERAKARHTAKQTASNVIAY